MCDGLHQNTKGQTKIHRDHVLLAAELLKNLDDVRERISWIEKEGEYRVRLTRVDPISMDGNGETLELPKSMVERMRELLIDERESIIQDLYKLNVQI